VRLRLRRNRAGVTPDGDPVTAGQPGRPRPPGYEVRVRGRLGTTTLRAFPALRAETKGQDTLLYGVPDQAALHGVLAQIEALGLELLEVRRQSPSSVTPPHPGTRNAEPR
jgi:hypothetical protein